MKALKQKFGKHGSRRDSLNFPTTIIFRVIFEKLIVTFFYVKFIICDASTIGSNLSL